MNRTKPDLSAASRKALLAAGFSAYGQGPRRRLAAALAVVPEICEAHNRPEKADEFRRGLRAASDATVSMFMIRARGLLTLRRDEAEMLDTSW